mmetsp:Transcript_9977/g.21175  ORF Transcript_9977/g.21175 Transcript_9977/m.21175 type:complete len:443 (+) Transcript_9977:317-1645(+)
MRTPLLQLGKEIYSGAKGVDESVDLFHRVVHVQRRPRGPRRAQLAVQRLSAVVSRADGDAVLIEEGGQVGGVDALVVERTERGAVAAGGGVGPVDADARHFAQPAVEVRAKLLLVALDLFHAEGREVVDRRAQPHRLCDRRRACLEAAGRRRVGGAFEEDVRDHLAAALPRRHLLQQLEAAVEKADARGAAHLVPRGDEEVAAEPLHVDRHVRHALARVDQHARADALRGGDDLLDRRDGAECIGDVREGDELGARREQRGEVRGVDALVLVQPRVLEREVAPLCEQLPRHQIGVMLRHREHHLVAGAEPRAVRRRHQVDRLGRAAREDDLLPRRRVDEGGHLVARAFVRRRRTHRERVRAAVDVGVVARLVRAHRGDDGRWLVRGGGGVEVGEAAGGGERLIENRKVSAAAGAENAAEGRRGGLERGEGGEEGEQRHGRRG